MNKNRHIYLCLQVTTIFLVIVFSGCSPQGTTEPSPEPISTSEPQETLTQPVEQPTLSPTPMIERSEPMTEGELEDSLTEAIQGEFKEIIYDFQDEPGTIFVKWEFFPEYSTESIVDTAKEDTAAILRTIYYSGMDFNEVIVSGWFTQTVDINNNVEYTELLQLYYGRNKLDGIKWDSLRVQYIWLIADDGQIHWLLEE
jgi:hypothetical protein